MSYPGDVDRLLATLRDGAWLDAQVFPPLAYAVPGLIPEGSVLLVGAPKIGKSWLVLAVGLAASDGGKALGVDIPKRPVLYAALEDGDRRLQDRCRRLLAGERIPPEFQYLTVIEPGRVGDHRRRVDPLAPGAAAAGHPGHPRQGPAAGRPG